MMTDRDKPHGWLPIEGAPMDGTQVLVLCMGDISIAQHVKEGWAAISDGTPVVESQTDFHTEYSFLSPELWMPLPAPPVSVPNTLESEAENG